MVSLIIKNSNHHQHKQFQYPNKIVWKDEYNEEYLKKNRADLIVVGRIGKYLTESGGFGHQIFYFDLDDEILSEEISKQFNVTIEVAIKEIDFVRDKYGKAIRKSSKGLKKLKSLPKSKPPGIGIDIQGRERDKYKIRISGARNKEQLNRIIDFMNILKSIRRD